MSGETFRRGGGAPASGASPAGGEATPWRGRRLHIVGVGGAGMSAYARAAHALGARVTGSDRADSPYLESLRAEGVLERAFVGHAAENLPAGAEADGLQLVHSSAIPPENPERRAARERGVPERPRAWLLGELSALRRTIAVAGTHGKTSTSAMTLHALRGAGLRPGWLIGGSPGGGLPNSSWTDSPWLVVEADESDRSMLSLHVEIGVVTNVELDHHSEYSSLSEVRAVFRDFAAAAGAVVVWDRPELVELLDGRAEDEIVRFDVVDPTLLAGGSRFRWRNREVTLAVPGAHNARNAAAALEAARLAGADLDAAVAALASFGGAGRRFERLGRTAAGALVVDDYAHHPTEVAETLRAARAELPVGGRLFALFQPHLYSRTQRLGRELGEALANGADAVAVLDVYASRERAGDHPGVSGLLVARAAAEAGDGRTVMWLPDFDAAEEALARQLRACDICVAMGAGDIDALARRMVS